jgi:hypothetical protein
MIFIGALNVGMRSSGIGTYYDTTKVLHVVSRKWVWVYYQQAFPVLICHNLFRGRSMIPPPMSATVLEMTAHQVDRSVNWSRRKMSGSVCRCRLVKVTGGLIACTLGRHDREAGFGLIYSSCQIRYFHLRAALRIVKGSRSCSCLGWNIPILNLVLYPVGQLRPWSSRWTWFYRISAGTSLCRVCYGWVVIRFSTVKAKIL